MSELVKRNEKGQLAKGSQLNKKYSEKDLVKVFWEVAEKCIEGEFLSIQECQMASGIPPSTFYDVSKKYDSLEDPKRQMNDAIIATVNRMGLTNKFNATMCVWRLKNLGERDKTEVAHTHAEQPIFKLT